MANFKTTNIASKPSPSKEWALGVCASNREESVRPTSGPSSSAQKPVLECAWFSLFSANAGIEESTRMSRGGMNGQWIGIYGGTTKGHIHVNIDEDQACYRAVAYLFNTDTRLPIAVAYFSTADKERN